MKLKDKVVWRENSSRSNRRGNNLQPKLSYAEAVHKSSQDLWKGPIIETTSNTPSWLVINAVGRMSPEVSFKTLREEFVKGGMSRVKLRYMGDNLVLLTPNYGERLEEIIKLNNEWFGSLLETIEPWTESYVAGYKIVWVRCHGLPLPLWNKDCFSKVVREVASLVEVDESTLSWENLEYARLQVRLLKSCKVEMMKSLRINGKVYNVTIVEEVFNQERGECTCIQDHFASSDSISSSETVVEETFFSGRSIEEGDDYNHGGLRRNSVPEVEEQIQPLVETKWELLEERAQSDKGCQIKGDFSFTNEVKHVQGVSEGGETLFVANQVKDACKVIQQSLFNLMEGVQVCNSISIGPKQGATQVEKRGAFSKEASAGGPITGSNGKAVEQRCATEQFVAMSSSPLTNIRSREVSYSEHLRARKPLESDSGVYPCCAIHQCSKEEGSLSGSSDPQSNEKSRRSKEVNAEGSIDAPKVSVRMEMASKTSSEIRRLRDHVLPIAQPKWRSNGGVGSLHQGVNSSSMLSHCSFAESSTNINLCNNQLKNEEKVVEYGIWVKT